MEKKRHLFEVSWEVCNKVGGIYEVVASKARHAVKVFDDEYFLLGPDTKSNAEFTETEEAIWDILRFPLKEKGFKCRFGRWEIPGRPRVILVDFNGRHNPDILLHHLWELFGVDSLSGGWDYKEPVLFSYTCGEIIAVAHQILSSRDKSYGIAHFHEWMCGAGILALKEFSPFVGTVFTTHATMLGRAMSGSGEDIYTRRNEISPVQEADRYNITAKCSMETVSAREADVFTTVSGITAEESRIFLNRKPDLITDNGLDLTTIHDYGKDRPAVLENRKKILDAVEKLLRRKLPESTRIVVISGRYEFHNKGVDLFLDALATVQKQIKETDLNVLALCLMMGGHSGVNPQAVSGDPNVFLDSSHPDCGFRSSHYVYDAEHDPIFNMCDRLGLKNKNDANVQVVFVPALLDGNDGFFNMKYFDVLSGCDLGVFPSWYEPWGYTPHESAAYSVPTITTDLSGFGLWIRELEAKHGVQQGVNVIVRNNVPYQTSVDALAKRITEYLKYSDEELNEARIGARNAVAHAAWQEFFALYKKAYSMADSQAHHRRHANKEQRISEINHILNPRSSAIPFLRSFYSILDIPERLMPLRELSKNLWWCWHQSAIKLFQALSPKMWEECKHNPIYMLEHIGTKSLSEFQKSELFLKELDRVMDKFYTEMTAPYVTTETITKERPIAYFSTEYGLHESLCLYSGGLGVLSGDHLKSASDEHLPLVGIGLFYRNGYFLQHLDKNGRQIPFYPENKPENLPLELILDAKGEPLTISVPLGSRSLYAQIWKLQVGRIPLYLLDTNVPQNSDDDKIVTARLYEADRDIRLRQEILLGMGGVRMLSALGIVPSVWHMNEGHSAFLVLERLRQHMLVDELSRDEAINLVRASSVFTTHTPVDAGNERFSVDRMELYFTEFAKTINMTWQDFLNMGRVEGGNASNFDMTVLALRMSIKANGVSAMHGAVSRRMWQNIWKGFEEFEVPIGYVTNGVHTASYVGPGFKWLLEFYLGKNWLGLKPDDPKWEIIHEIPDMEFLSAKNMQKDHLIIQLRERLPKCTAYSSIRAEDREEWLSALNRNSLIIGFARRFAPYKRATLLFADPDRLANILNNPKRPVVIVMAGKAHPADTAGIDLIAEVVRMSLDPRFRGKIFFLEGYDLEISRYLARGCDVWLNTPRRPYEASGTSGEKVPVNAGINLSISDGWWVEGDNGKNGWTIGPKASVDMLNAEQNDYADAESLYTLLEQQVVPTFFDRDIMGVSKKWLDLTKESMASLTAQYSCRRMVRDYMEKIYTPAANYGATMDPGRHYVAKKITEWLRLLPHRFNTLNIKFVDTTGFENSTITKGQAFHIKLETEIGKMKVEEILVQLIVGSSDGVRFTGEPDVVAVPLSSVKNGIATYEMDYTIKEGGKHSYGVRILPTCTELDSPLRSGLVKWV